MENRTKKTVRIDDFQLAHSSELGAGGTKVHKYTLEIK
jgi:hypothetical protein